MSSKKTSGSNTNDDKISEHARAAVGSGIMSDFSERKSETMNDISSTWR